MNIWVAFWIIVAIVMGLAEVATSGLVSIWFCLSALVTSVVAVFCQSVMVLIAVFVISSTVFLLCTRRFVKKFLKNEPVPTNADRIIGKTAIVTEDIDPISGAGCVTADGKAWSVKAEEPIDRGSLVKIIAIDGVRLVVKKEE